MCLEKGWNYVFERLQQKGKVRSMDLSFKNLQIRREKGQQ